MRHKNADIAIEWYKDTSRVVQYFWNNQWNDWNWITNPHFSENCKWRFKPESNPDKICSRKIYLENGEMKITFAEHWERENAKFTFDGETGELKSVEVIDE